MAMYLKAAAILLVLLVGTAVLAERDTVDRIVAVVGEDAILASELAGQMQLTAFQTGEQPRTQSQIEKFQKRVLDDMISDKLFLIEAKKDTSITVRPEEVDRALDNHIANIIEQQFSSEQDFLTALEQEGITLRELKRQYRPDIENRILKQRLIQTKLYDVSISRREVEEFYREFKDSIPNQPEAVKLAHILLTFQPSPDHEAEVKEHAAELRRMVLDGADFATISAQNSDMGAGANGGDLGWVSRADVVPEFARAAFNLAPGDISGVIRTQFGYHVIKCEGKRDDKLKLRHILLTVTPTAADSALTLELADSLIQELRAGADFGEMAKGLSADNDTRAQGGELGWFAVEQLPPEFTSTVSDWKTAGEVRGPVTSRYGVHILKLLEYQPARTFTLDKDYDRIKELARQDKTGRLVDDWIEELKERTYIEYRLDDYANR